MRSFIDKPLSFFVLPIEKKVLLIRVFFLALCFKVLLKLMNRQRVLSKFCVPSSPSSESIVQILDENKTRYLSNLSWCMKCLSRNFPRLECYTKAITGKYLLRNKGISSVLSIGFSKNDKHKLKGHAWLSVGELIVTGNISLENFEELFAFR